MVPLASFLAKLLGIPLWVQVHGIEAWQRSSRLDQLALQTSTLITAVSRYTRRRLLEWVAIDPGRVRVLPNTVDPKFKPGPKSHRLVQRLGLNGKKVLLTVARLPESDRKGHDRVIRALSRILTKHPETIYLIVGEGKDRARLEGIAAGLGVSESVRFVGKISADELPDYYRLGDVFIMLNKGEGFGIVFLEALASGIRVIGGNRDGGTDPLDDNERAIMVDPDDQEAIELAIEAALESPESCDNQEESRFSAEKFSAHVTALLKSNVITQKSCP